MRLVTHFLMTILICITAVAQDLPGQVYFHGLAGFDFAQVPPLPGSLSGSMNVEGEIDTTTFFPTELEGTAAILMDNDSTGGQVLSQFAIEDLGDGTYNLFAMLYNTDEEIEVGNVSNPLSAYFLFAYHMDSLAVPDMQSDSLDMMDLLNLISAEYRFVGAMTALEFTSLEPGEIAWNFSGIGADLDNSMMIVSLSSGYVSLEGIPLNVERAPSTLPRDTWIAAYPNPFNPTTRISVHLPQAGEFALRVYNILGRQQELYELGFLPAGESHVQMNADNWPGGLYLLSLESCGVRVAVERVTLLK